MRNKIVLIFAIIVLGIIVINTTGFFKEKTLANVYEKLRDKKSYIFEMEKNSENKLIVAKKDNKIVIDQYTNGEHTTTLIKDNTTYFILHEREEYYVYNQTNDIEKNVLIEGFDEVLSNDYVLVSKEEIVGKKYTYQEYNGSSFFTLSNIATNQQIKTRFYFDNKGKLVYIKNLYGDEFEILKIKLETKVDDSIFEIPSHYAEN